MTHEQRQELKARISKALVEIDKCWDSQEAEDAENQVYDTATRFGIDLDSVDAQGRLMKATTLERLEFMAELAGARVITREVTVRIHHLEG